MDGSQPDHNSGARRQHPDLPGPGPLLPHGYRGGALVDNILLCSGSLHISDTGRHWREAGPENQDQQSPGGTVRPRLWQSQYGLCQHRQLLCCPARPVPWLDVVPGTFVISVWPRPHLTSCLSVCVPPRCSTALTGRPTSRAPSPSAPSTSRRDRSWWWPSCSFHPSRASSASTSGRPVWVPRLTSPPSPSPCQCSRHLTNLIEYFQLYFFSLNQLTTIVGGVCGLYSLFKSDGTIDKIFTGGAGRNGATVAVSVACISRISCLALPCRAVHALALYSCTSSLAWFHPTRPESLRFLGGVADHIAVMRLSGTLTEGWHLY